MMKTVSIHSLQKPVLAQTFAWSRTFAGMNSIPGSQGSDGDKV